MPADPSFIVATELNQSAFICAPDKARTFADVLLFYAGSAEE